MKHKIKLITAMMLLSSISLSHQALVQAADTTEGQSNILVKSTNSGNKINSEKTREISEQTITSKRTNQKKTKKTTIKKSKKKVKVNKIKSKPYADPTDMRKMSGSYWKYSSQTKTKYPNLKKVKNLNLRVSIKGNRVYVRSGNKVLYTMYASAGRIVNAKSLTPTGIYKTNSYHPYRFSSAIYPVGWKGQEYLLHSVPTYLWSSKYILTEAKKLGKTPASHGCIRLSVSDAKWLQKNIPYHTKVIIKNN